MKPAQLTLWEEPAPVIMHHSIEVGWQSGYREIVCTARTPRPNRPGDYENYAGFVGSAALPQECRICNPQK